MACLTSMIEPLRAANEIAGMNAFEWSLFGETPGRVISSAKVGFDADQRIGDAQGLEHLFLLSSPAETFADPVGSPAHLRLLARHGVVLGAISGGVFPLVRAGVVQADPVSVHWCYEAAFKVAFPDVAAKRDVIVATPRLATMSGAAAAFDFALDQIEQKLGRDIAHEVACWFQHPLVRGAGVGQKVPMALEPVTGDVLPDLVAQAVEVFTARMSDGVSIAEVAEASGVTPRQIERAFKAATGRNPSSYFREMRMKAARQLVTYSSSPIADIAAAVGYRSAAPLITHYRQAYGLTPSQDRRRINQFRVTGNAPVPST